ncbi:MAG: hypothetical protein LBJ14_01380 [Desulfarculales bacterium]|jgi:hypothetical protein|nr:hypothetical protein [Desulfarculales bacterium]
MDLVILFETVMLLCFAASWPVSIYKSVKSRTAKGKSGVFIMLVFSGYIAGIGKCLLDAGLDSFLLIPYTFNFFIVSIDLVLYFRNCKLDKLRDAEGEK